MKSLFWKRTELQVATEKVGAQLRFQQGSSLTYLEDQKKIVAFGALKTDSPVEATKEVKEEPKKPSFSFKGGFSLAEKQAAVIDTLQSFSSTTGKWTISNCTGKHPSVRVHHYTLYEQPYLIIYSGLQKKLLNDMYVLNCRTFVWKKMFSLESPPPRLAGAFLQLKDKKYLIGGCKHPETGSDLYNDVWSLSFANVNWQVTASDLPGSVWTNIEYNNLGNTFVPLKHFTANAVGDEAAYIFGGFTTNNEPTNKQYLFNAQSKEIKLLESKGPRPSPRGKHKMIAVKPNLLLLYGGYPQCDADHTKLQKEVFIYHVELATWERPVVGGGLPTELSYFSMSIKNSDGRGEIVLLGSKALTNEIQQYELAANVQEEYTPRPAVQLIEKEKPLLDKKVLREASQRKNVEQELQEGYKMTEQQRQKMQQLEQTLAAMKRDNEELKARLERSRQHNRQQVEMESQQNVELTSKVLSLLLMERKKRWFLELKSNILQNTIKDAEKLVILMDAYSEEEAKTHHIMLLKEYRKEMEEILSKENALKREIKSRKSALDLDKLLRDNLSEEEARLMNML